MFDADAPRTEGCAIAHRSRGRRLGSAGLPLPSRADRGEGGAMHGGAFFFREVGAIGDGATGRANVRFGADQYAGIRAARRLGHLQIQMVVVQGDFA